jgi:hypothetical protein
MTILAGEMVRTRKLRPNSTTSCMVSPVTDRERSATCSDRQVWPLQAMAHRRVCPRRLLILLGLWWLPAVHRPGDGLVPREDRGLQLLRGGVQRWLGGHTGLPHVSARS